MFNFTFMPDVGMGYVSLDPYTLFECFLAWPFLHLFAFLEMFLLSFSPTIDKCLLNEYNSEHSVALW